MCLLCLLEMGPTAIPDILPTSMQRRHVCKGNIAHASLDVPSSHYDRAGMPRWYRHMCEQVHAPPRPEANVSERRVASLRQTLPASPKAHSLHVHCDAETSFLRDLHD